MYKDLRMRPDHMMEGQIEDGTWVPFWSTDSSDPISLNKPKPRTHLRRYRHIPTTDPQTGAKNPHYPEVACRTCCQSNSVLYHSADEFLRHAHHGMIEQRIKAHPVPDWRMMRGCPVCHSPWSASAPGTELVYVAHYIEDDIDSREQLKGASHSSHWFRRSEWTIPKLVVEVLD